jgi:peptide/nickel transport system ATP-binding protein
MLEVNSLGKVFPPRGWLGKPFRAVEGVGFSLREGEAIGIVGESGSGKTTVGRLVSVLLRPSAGSVQFDGVDVSAIGPDAFVRHPLRRQVQHVFQDATENLTPHFTAEDAIADPLRRLLGMRDASARVRELAASVGLPPELLSRYPHQLSGGQRARVGIARALATSPRLVILDEPTASLDVSVQAGVLRTLHELRERLGLAMIFISHDIEVVRLMCDRVLVMREGVVVESGSVADVLGSPAQEYTRELIASVPRMAA